MASASFSFFPDSWRLCHGKGVVIEIHARNAENRLCASDGTGGWGRCAKMKNQRSSAAISSDNCSSRYWQSRLEFEKQSYVSIYRAVCALLKDWWMLKVDLFARNEITNEIFLRKEKDCLSRREITLFFWHQVDRLKFYEDVRIHGAGINEVLDEASFYW